MLSFQKQIQHNPCFGCGQENPDGLGIESFWSNEDPETAICRFTPSPQHMSGSRKFLNGGIIATIIGCHCVCTAIADGYRRQNRAIGSEPTIWFATGELNLKYLRPVSLNNTVELRAKVITVKPRKTRLECQLWSEGRPCVSAELLAVEVDSQWIK
ncbi:PaaI family thioesterase [Halioxenophilus sp. WMMB6]|uniref:PaaI family thioesterase n=1 Tax=Halioxenophilus sp. WMMB6 TaxID=3073815 RepID=UPI00295E5753|nr:PaaI family thioesterase [Halioxenophilus sp. WMMB6]